MTRTQRWFWIVVLAVVVAIVAAVSAYATVGRPEARDKSGFCAVMPDAIGLYAGNQVTAMGYGIGTIEKITPQDGGVRVDFSVDSGRPIPADVKAVTRSKSVLADRSLELVGNYRSGPRLQQGDCIARTNAFTPKSISEITGSAADLIEQIAPEGDTRSVQGAIKGMSGALAGTGPDVARLMETAAAAAESPERIVSDIGSIILNMTPLTTEALDQWSDIASIVRQTPAATDAFADKLWPGVINLITGLKPVLNAIWDFYPKYAEKYLYPTLDYLSQGIHIAAMNVGPITRALQALPGVSAAAAVVAAEGKGAALRIGAPSVRVRTPDARKLCAQLNSARQGACKVQGSDASVSGLDALGLLMGGRGR